MLSLACEKDIRIMKKILLTIGILTLTALAGTLWYLQNNKNETTVPTVSVVINEKTNNNAEKLQTKETSKQAEKKISDGNEKVLTEKDANDEIDTSNWKEYCNEKYGFCVRYPRKWTYEEFFDRRGVLFSDNEMIDTNGYPFPIDTKIKVSVVYPPKDENTEISLDEAWLKEKQSLLDLKNSSQEVKEVSIIEKDEKLVLSIEYDDNFAPANRAPLKAKTAMVRFGGKIISFATHPLAKNYNYDKDDPVYRAMIKSLRLTN